MSPDAIIALCAVGVTLLLAIVGAAWKLSSTLTRQDVDILSIKDELRWQSQAILRLFRGSRSDPPTRPRGKLLTLDDPLEREK